jgi:hypothetical protein
LWADFAAVYQRQVNKAGIWSASKLDPRKKACGHKHQKMAIQIRTAMRTLIVTSAQMIFHCAQVNGKSFPVSKKNHFGTEKKLVLEKVTSKAFKV